MGDADRLAIIAYSLLSLVLPWQYQVSALFLATILVVESRKAPAAL